MDRRTFLGTAAMAAAAVAVSHPLSASAFVPEHAASDEIPSPRRKVSEPSPDGLAVRFLGTGGADWKGPDDRGEHRRLTSLLVEQTFLIDFTATARDMLPEGLRPEIIFYTHSHRDHYQPKDALEAGVRQVFVNESILQKVKDDFEAAAAQLGCPAPIISSLSHGASTRVGDVVVTALPSNHFVSPTEQTQMYLLEKGGVRLLYATDTGGLPAHAARIAGIDAHKKPGQPITALIMEATMGPGHEDDYRLFSHSSVETVHQTWRVLNATGRYTPPEGQPVYLTHMARTLHGTQAELDATLPAPLRAAYDGLEVVFRPA